MIDPKDSAAELIERLKRKAPEYLDLICAETVEEFEAAFTPLLEEAVIHLETNKKNFNALDEEGLTAAIAGRLMAVGLIVDQEKNSNGHVDITIEANHCSPARRKLGEAKIYAGPAYHIKGMKQLLGRYSTGREIPGLMLNYVRNPDIKKITQKIRATLDKQRPVSQGTDCTDHCLKWSFVTTHKHTSGEKVSVCHVGLNLHV